MEWMKLILYAAGLLQAVGGFLQIASGHPRVGLAFILVGLANAVFATIEK